MFVYTTYLFGILFAADQYRSWLVSTHLMIGSISAALSCPGPSPRSAGSFPEQRLVIEPNLMTVTRIVTRTFEVRKWLCHFLMEYFRRLFFHSPAAEHV